MDVDVAAVLAHCKKTLIPAMVPSVIIPIAFVPLVRTMLWLTAG